MAIRRLQLRLEGYSELLRSGVLAGFGGGLSCARCRRGAALGSRAGLRLGWRIARLALARGVRLARLRIPALLAVSIGGLGFLVARALLSALGRIPRSGLGLT